MSSVYRNNEGYVDTTAGMAIAHAAVAEKKKKYRPIVYICSKYRGDTEKNAADALKYEETASRSHRISFSLIPASLMMLTRKNGNSACLSGSSCSTAVKRSGSLETSSPTA